MFAPSPWSVARALFANRATVPRISGALIEKCPRTTSAQIGSSAAGSSAVKRAGRGVGGLKGDPGTIGESSAGAGAEVEDADAPADPAAVDAAVVADVDRAPFLVAAAFMKWFAICAARNSGAAELNDRGCGGGGGGGGWVC